MVPRWHDAAQAAREGGVKIVTVDQMREIERRAETEHGLTSPVLMEHAGQSIAEMVWQRITGEATSQRVLVLAGPGNNGGDGRVATRFLARWGATVTLYAWKERQLETNGRIVAVGDDLGPVVAELRQASVVVDALLGTGHARPLDPSMRALLAAVEAERARRPTLFVVALDLPSGLNADSGAVDAGTAHADLTITLAYPKLGLLLFPGAEYVGELEVGEIGLPPAMADDIALEMLDAPLVRGLLPPRPLDSNKGTFGKVMLLAGSLPYPGSAYLAATAAGRVGAGLVTLAVAPEMAPVYAVKLSEATQVPLPPESGSPVERARVFLAGLTGYAATLIGPGLGQADVTREMVLAVFDGLRTLPENERPRVVVDADGLNALARIDRWWERLPRRSVLTPHPGEMTRLRGGARVSGGGADRLEVAQRAAEEWGHVVVLKGACTVVAAPGEGPRICWPPNPALATAGTGDVLAGTVAGLLAQGAEPFTAASAAVYLHARAGLGVSARLGSAGLLASDLLGELPIALHDTRDGLEE